MIFAQEESEAQERAERQPEYAGGHWQDDVPSVEWWDQGFLPDDHRKEDYNCVTEEGRFEVRPKKISPYVEHPIPVDPPCEVKMTGAIPLMLTKKERRKVRTQMRRKREQEKRDMIRMGLVEPPPSRSAFGPSRRLCHFCWMACKGDACSLINKLCPLFVVPSSLLQHDASAAVGPHQGPHQDRKGRASRCSVVPCCVPGAVRNMQTLSLTVPLVGGDSLSQYERRKKQHEEMNAARKLTKEQKAEKMRKKFTKDTDVQVQVTVYWCAICLDLLEEFLLR